jgi:hypothetical protein
VIDRFLIVIASVKSTSMQNLTRKLFRWSLRVFSVKSFTINKEFDYLSVIKFIRKIICK